MGKLSGSYLKGLQESVPMNNPYAVVFSVCTACPLLYVPENTDEGGGNTSRGILRVTTVSFPINLSRRLG